MNAHNARDLCQNICVIRKTRTSPASAVSHDGGPAGIVGVNFLIRDVNKLQVVRS
jgi:hypothetical protein